MRAVARGAHAAKTLPGDTDSVADAVLRMSRALVAVAGRSLAAVDADITLGQFRALVVLAKVGPLTMGDLAEALGVHRSTATRLCDRLVRKQLVRRATAASNRREVLVSLAGHGRRLVDDVTRMRRAEIAEIMQRMPPGDRAGVVSALSVFAEAAGEPPEAPSSFRWAL